MFFIQRFPDELLFLTFESLSRDAPDALAISHVDRRWRELSLKIPGLWTSLDLRLGSGSVHAFARRSRDLQLHIQVFHRSTDYVGAEASAIHAFMDAATAYFARWSTLTIDAISAHVVEMVLDRCRGIPEVSACRENQLPLPLMTQVVLRVHREFAADGDGYPRGRVAPFHPRDLVLDGVAAWEMGFCSHVLERLELHNLSWDTGDIRTATPRLDFLTEVLRACPNLQELVLDDAGPISPLGNPQAAELLHLQALTIRKVLPEMASKLLALLSVPNLQSLQIHIAGTRTLTDLSRCLATFQDKTTIRHIHLAYVAHRTSPAQVGTAPRDDDLTGTGLLDASDSPLAWDNFPELSKLVLEGTGIGEHAVAALSALPKLQHLALRYENSVSVAAIESLLLARLRDEGASALHKLDIYLCKFFSTEAAAKLCSLVSELGFVADGQGDYDSDQDEDYEPSEVSGDSDSVFTYSDW